MFKDWSLQIKLVKDKNVEKEVSSDDVISHFEQHRTAYLFGAGIAIAGITALLMRGHSSNFLGSLDGTDKIIVRPLAFLSKQTVVTVIARDGRGHPGYIVKCMETGDVFLSQGEAAEWAGVTAANMSQHLTGRFPHVAHGLHFERLAA